MVCQSRGGWRIGVEQVIVYPSTIEAFLCRACLEREAAMADFINLLAVDLPRYPSFPEPGTRGAFVTLVLDVFTP